MTSAKRSIYRLMILPTFCGTLQPSLLESNSSAQSDILRACDIFRGYFEIQEHETKTRNYQCLLKLPRIKTEYTRKSFRFKGAKIYNDLPI